MLLVLKSLLHNKGTYLLVTCQVAITLAVLINAIALVIRSQEIVSQASGMERASIIAINAVPFGQAFNDEVFGQAQLLEDLDAIRRTPYVLHATVTNAFPGDIGSNSGVRDERDADGDGASAGVYTADQDTLASLDLSLIAGRNFRAEEIFFSQGPSADKALPQLIITTQALANRVFPDEDALGKTVRINGTSRTIIGITGLFRGRNPITGDSALNVFIPGYYSAPKANRSFLINVDPDHAQDLMASLPELLLGLNKDRDIESVRLLSELLARGNAMYSYGGLVLMVISALLVFTTALGVFGVAYFSVTKRTRQIGVRRALGATRAEIMKLFFIENLLTTGTGVIVGSLLAIALNIVMTSLGLGRADWAVTALGIAFMLLVGQLSVLIPAYKASRIEPAIATRQ